ncbi:conserved hypothetical protein [Leptospira interrogans serovar Manilae]|uniref:Uncharacterized protein n=1 Tax=Leptospira interrogans serovar Manilae TaxID=214675 RepID=A0AAQ1NV92_LEPIR|nr:conserved hypothetical protein [Leptospira interrogans serovar Manilae]
MNILNLYSIILCFTALYQIEYRKFLSQSPIAGQNNGVLCYNFEQQKESICKNKYPQYDCFFQNILFYYKFLNNKNL